MLQSIKSLATGLVAVSLAFVDHDSFFITNNPSVVDKLTLGQLKSIYNSLNNSEKELVHTICWELMNKEHSKNSISLVEYGSKEAIEYGEENLFKNLKITARALHRAKAIPPCFYKDPEEQNLYEIIYPINMLRSNVSKRTQYYSIHKNNNINYPIGWVGYINGMGLQFDQLMYDSKVISNQLLEGNDVHCVYLPTFSNSEKDIGGIFFDSIRHLTVNGGAFSKAACLLAQMWIDFLHDNPDKYFLQIASSDGATFTNSAINILIDICPEYLSRMCFVLLAPCCFILPNKYIKENQIIHLVKKEDSLIRNFGTNSYLIDSESTVKIVPHEEGSSNTHYYLTDNYIDAIRPFIQSFKKFGKFY